MDGKLARFKSDMLDFAYKASLHLEHDEQTPEEISAGVGLTPIRAGRRDNTRLPFQLKNFWACRLTVQDDVMLDEFIEHVAYDIIGGNTYLTSFLNDGGRGCVFLTLLSRNCCAFELTNDTLRQLVECGVSIRFDYYAWPEEAEYE